MEKEKVKQVKSLMKDLLLLNKQNLRKLQFTADVLSAREQMMELWEEMAKNKEHENKSCEKKQQKNNGKMEKNTVTL